MSRFESTILRETRILHFVEVVVADLRPPVRIEGAAVALDGRVCEIVLRHPRLAVGHEVVEDLIAGSAHGLRAR